MSMFERSNTCRGANVNFNLIQKIECWDNTLTERLETYPKDNSQINDSFSLPESITGLVKKLREQIRQITGRYMQLLRLNAVALPPGVMVFAFQDDFVNKKIFRQTSMKAQLKSHLRTLQTMWLMSP